MVEYAGRIFVFLITFWSIMGVISHNFDITLETSNVLDESNTGGSSKLYDFLDTFGLGFVYDFFEPIFRITYFSYNDEIPKSLSIMLGLTGFLTILVIFGLIAQMRGGQ